jgi:hypothetical protein
MANKKTIKNLKNPTIKLVQKIEQILLYTLGNLKWNKK